MEKKLSTKFKILRFNLRHLKRLRKVATCHNYIRSDCISVYEKMEDKARKFMDEETTTYYEQFHRPISQVVAAQVVTSTPSAPQK